MDRMVSSLPATGFPECRNTKTLSGKNRCQMSKCGKEIVLKKTKKGRKYYGCENNPECDFMSWSRPVEEKCPEMRRLYGCERQ